VVSSGIAAVVAVEAGLAVAPLARRIAQACAARHWAGLGSARLPAFPHRASAGRATRARNWRCAHSPQRCAPSA